MKNKRTKEMLGALAFIPSVCSIYGFGWDHSFLCFITSEGIRTSSNRLECYEQATWRASYSCSKPGIKWAPLSRGLIFEGF